MSYFLTGLVTRARFPSQMELFKKKLKWLWNSELKRNILPYFAKYKGFFFNDYKIYFNSVVI